MKNFTCIANLHFCVVLLFMWLLPTNGYCQVSPIIFTAGGKRYHNTMDHLERYGIVTLSGRDTILPVKYRKIIPYQNFLKATEFNETEGIFDYSGKEILPMSLELIDIVNYFDSNYVFVTRDKYNRRAVYTATGEELLPPSFNLIPKIKGNSTNFFIKIIDGPFEGIVDMHGKEIIPPIYSIVDGYASDDGNYYTCVKYGDGSSCMDWTGKELIHTDARYIKPRIIDGKLVDYIVTDKGCGIGKIDLDGNIIEPVEPKVWIEDSTAAYTRIRNTENMMGVMSKAGDTIVPLRYNDIGKTDSLYYTWINDKLGIYDLHGQCIINADTSSYYNAWDCWKMGYILVRGKHGYNIYKKNEQRIFEKDYPYITGYTNNDSVFLVKKDLFQKGAIFINNQQKTDFLYDSYIFFNQKPYLGVRQNGKIGLISYDGEPVINCLYDDIEFINDDNGYKIRVRDGSCHGLYSCKGELLIPSTMYTFIHWNKNDKQYEAHTARYGKYFYDIDGILKGATETDMKADSLILKADKAFMADKFGEAIRLYNAANKLRPEATSYYNLGASYFNRGNYKKSISCLESCFNYSPSANIKTQAYDLLDRARQLREEQIVARQQMALAFLGAVVTVTAGALTGAIGNSNHTTYASPASQKSISSQSSSYNSSSSSSSYSSSSNNSSTSSVEVPGYIYDRVRQLKHDIEADEKRLVNLEKEKVSGNWSTSSSVLYDQTKRQLKERTQEYYQLKAQYNIKDL